MNILVIGSGGREHAIIKKLKENKSVTEIFVTGKNAGLKKEATLVDILPIDIEGIVAFAVNNKIDYVVVSPDTPLVLGLVDALEKVGIPAFGPSKKAAHIEGSKVFAKKLMKKYHIPTANYEVFTTLESAYRYLDTASMPAVIKADGLAYGKGVIIASTKEEAKEAVSSILIDKKFGDSGNQIVIEEYLLGPEVSVLAFTDGHVILPMVSSMDHKKALDGDTGLNTGGMGAIAPNPYYTEAIAEECMRTIFIPTIEALRKEGRTFKGCLYIGLMLTPTGPKVIEYNCRFGDPETQVVLPLLKSDLLTIMQAVTEERLAEVEMTFSNQSACCVILVSEGYPTDYDKGFPIVYTEKAEPHLYMAGVCEKDGCLATDGGRVVGVTQVADTLEEAISGAYELVQEVTFYRAFYRKDIGKKALEAKGVQ